MEALIAGVATALEPVSIALIALGVVIGIVVGAIPGLSAPVAIAIAVPTTFFMSPGIAIGFLVGINKGGTVGGAISAILLNTPGSPDSAVTALDGHPLAKSGKPMKALKIALYSSVTGDSFSDLVLFAFAAPLALFALRIGPVESFGVVVLALCVIGALVGQSVVKGLMAAFLGLFAATIGLDPEAATPRLTFGIPELINGLPLIAVGIGMLALAEILRQLEDRSRIPKTPIPLQSTKPEDQRLSWREYKSCLPAIARSTLIGTAVGVTPGIGSTVAAFLGYGAAKRADKDPDSFGTGRLEGIAAAEAANSSVVGSNLIPLLALGIPGNVTAALLVGAFIIHGIAPGPLVFEQHGEVIYGLFAAMVVANICNLVLGRAGLRLFVYVIRVPSSIIFPVVIVLCLTGSYIGGGGMFAVAVTIAFAIAGYLMRKLDFSFVTFVVGFVLGPMFERTLRQTLILTDGDLLRLRDFPIALALIFASALFIFVVVRSRRHSEPTLPYL